MSKKRKVVMTIEFELAESPRMKMLGYSDTHRMKNLRDALKAELVENVSLSKIKLKSKFLKD